MTPLSRAFRRGFSLSARRWSTSSSFCLGAVLLAFCLCALSGCEALKDHKCCLFSSDNKDKKFGDCLFPKDGEKKSCLFSEDSCLFGSSKAKRLSDKDAQDALARANAADNKGAWESTEEEAKVKNMLKEYVSTTQRPNGAVLFPERLTASGPLVTLEPRSIVAPVGSDVVMVASYVGSDSQYLRVGERIDWSLGANDSATFTEANVSSSLNPFLSTRQLSGRSISTTTSDRSWRVHRGTTDPTDDVTVLSGQTWAALRSPTEGASVLGVSAQSLDGSPLGRAASTIYWVDLAYRFPRSCVAKVGSPIDLTTSLRKRSNGEARENFIVRYEVLSSNASLATDDGRASQRVVDVATNKNGEASAALSAAVTGDGGTTKVLASIYLPSNTRSSDEPGVLVDKKTLFFTWTTSVPVTARFQMPAKYTPGEKMNCNLIVSNLSDFDQTVIVGLVLPQRMGIEVEENFAPTVNDDGLHPYWQINVGAQSQVSFGVVLSPPSDYDGAVPIYAIVRETSPSEGPARQSKQPPATTTPPAAMGGASNGASNPTAAPATSPSSPGAGVDPASVAPELPPATSDATGGL